MRPPCFQNGYFYLSSGNVVCQFSEGQIYEWHGVGLVSWGIFKADTTRGHDWNLKNIAFFRGFDAAVKLQSIPSGYSDSF
jgi:hypothetical protein